MHQTFVAVVGLIGLAIGSVIYKIIYEKFVSPLRHIPGPWYAPFTRFPRLRAGPIQKQQAQWCHALHMRYGPFVRIAPNEVLVGDVDALKEIHRMGTHFRKTDMYKFLSAHQLDASPGSPPHGLFQEVDPKIHQSRRRILAHGFSARVLRQTWGDLVRTKATRVLDRMQQVAQADPEGEVDILAWWMAMAGDVISQMSFGRSFDMLEADGTRKTYFREAIAPARFNLLAYESPLLYKVLTWLRIPAVEESVNTNRRLAEYGAEAVATSYKDAQVENIFTRIFAEADKEDVDISQPEMVQHASSFIIAGTDTTSNSLTYLVFAVLSQPSLHAALKEELAQLDAPLLDEQLEQLPILTATIRETLRLYGAASNGLPRYTPAGGAHFGGYYFPAGTIVTTQAWTYHRDPKFYPDPERFDHTRWLLPSSPALSPAAQASFHPFGLGSRICIGKHLAEMELRMGAALFFRRFPNAKLSPETTPESMHMVNIFLSAPRAGKCLVKL